MFVNELIKVKLSARNIKHYRTSLNEIFKIGEIIEINVNILREGSDQIVDVYCDECLENNITKIISKKLNNLIRDRKRNNGKDGCSDCARKRSGITKRLDYDLVYSSFTNKKMIPLFNYNDYKSNNQKLKFKCEKHRDIEQLISYDKLSSYKIACKLCRNELPSKKTRLDFIGFKNYFIERGLLPLFNNNDLSGIDDCNKKLSFKCNIHCDKIQKISYNALKQTKNGCKLCFNKIGENSSAWRGGITPLVRNMRAKLKEWTIEQLELSNYTCLISGVKGGKLVVHHIINFHTLLDKCISNLRYSSEKKLSDYNSEELLNIKNELLRLHYESKSVTISSELHNLFHKLYGKKNNNEEQFIEFTKYYKNYHLNNYLSDKYKHNYLD